MISGRVHDDLVARFYASAVGEAPWGETLAKTASAFGCSATILGVHRSTSCEVMAVESHNYDKAFLGEYFSGEIYAHDPRMPIVDQVALGKTYHDEMLYDPNDMERDPWVRASLDQLGVFDLMGVKLDLGGDGQFMRFALLRTRQEGRVDRDAVLAFRRLAPQIQQACTLGYLLESAAATQSALLEVVASKSEGLVLFDAFGRVAFINGAAERMLSADDGLALNASDFMTCRPPETRTLRRLIGEIIERSATVGSADGGQILVSRRSGRRPYVVNVSAAPRREAFLSVRAIACIVQILDLDNQPPPNRDTVRSVFGLTDREADLAMELVRTASLGRAALRCAMTPNTARNHLQSVFGKTGAHNQAEAIQLIGRLS